MIRLALIVSASSTALQRKIGETWELAWVIAMNACLSPPIVVPPGGEHTARIYVHEHSGGVVYPERARMIESGTYRVAWTGVLTAFDPNTKGFGPELPLEQRVSAPFTIEVPPLTQLTAPEAERLVRLLVEAHQRSGARHRGARAVHPAWPGCAARRTRAAKGTSLI